MNIFSPRKKLAMLALAVPVAMGLPMQVAAQDGELEEVIITGTRVADRSAADSPVPVDVISGSEFRDVASTDVQDMLRTSVPSFDVNTQPISDAATISRPANVRGLSPDNVLVLVNGKRRHRGSIISFLGGGISDGAQGVDLAAIPSLALKQVEILRDGASSALMVLVFIAGCERPLWRAWLLAAVVGTGCGTNAPSAGAASHS